MPRPRCAAALIAAFVILSGHPGAPVRGDGGFDGPYLGLRAGVMTSIEADERGDEAMLGRGAYAQGMTRVDLGLGYGLTPFERGYLGVEAGAVLYDGFSEEVERFVTEQGTTTQTLAGERGYWVRALAGYRSTERTLLYTTAGVQRRGFTITQQTGAGRERDEASFSGAGFGFGFRHRLRGGLFVVGEAFRTFYNRRRLDPPGSDIEITTTSVDIGLAYRF